MENAIWFILIIAGGIGLVFAGFWVIAKSGLPNWVRMLWGAIVLIVILFALVYLVRGDGPAYPPRF